MRVFVLVVIICLFVRYLTLKILIMNQVILTSIDLNELVKVLTSKIEDIILKKKEVETKEVVNTEQKSENLTRKEVAEMLKFTLLFIIAAIVFPDNPEDSSTFEILAPGSFHEDDVISAANGEIWLGVLSPRCTATSAFNFNPLRLSVKSESKQL